MLLPWIVAILMVIFYDRWAYSISETYYKEACVAPFMIILGSASVLLVCYDGYEKIDEIICTLAGIFGLGICLFPC